VRNKDNVDLGKVTDWPGADFVPSVNENERWDNPDPSYNLSWMPLIYYEKLSRTVPGG